MSYYIKDLAKYADNIFGVYVAVEVEFGPFHDKESAVSWYLRYQGIEKYSDKCYGVSITIIERST